MLIILFFNGIQTLKDVSGWVLESIEEVKAQKEKMKLLWACIWTDVLACSDILVHPGDKISIGAHEILLVAPALSIYLDLLI